MFRINVIAFAITALLASAPGMANAKKTVRSAQRCAGAWAFAHNDATSRRAAAAMLCLLNRERASHRLSSLHSSAPLVAAAAGHSGEMVADQYMSHSSPSGASVRVRALETGYLSSLTCSTLLGETIAFGSGSYATPAHLVASLMADPVQRHVLLDRRFRDAGVGMALGAPMAGVGGSAATVTVDLGRR